MSLELYPRGGLRFWTEKEIKSRHRICNEIEETIRRELLRVNQGWAFEQVDTPVIMPVERLNKAYTDDDVFLFNSPLGDTAYSLRAETTDGSYLMASHLLKTTKSKPPLCVWQLGQSFRKELSDGASASNLRFNSFYQLEFQLIYSDTTQYDYGEMLRDELAKLVSKITGLETRLVDSDRIPSYATETKDIEVYWKPPTKDHYEWKEVCSTSRRTDFPQLPNSKNTLNVFEIAFGADRLVCVNQRDI